MPTTVTIQPDPTAGKDAHVYSADPDVNYGTATILSVGDASTAGYKRRSLLQFDLSTIPLGAGIASASLYLYFCDYLSTTAYYVRAHEVLGDWTEAGVTWNNQPSHNASYESQVSLAGTTGWYAWDLRALVDAWHKGTKANRGVKLVSSGEGTAKSGKDFYSSDYTTNTTLRPKLEITYTARPTVSITSPSGTQASPTVVSNDVTPDLVGVYNSDDNVDMAYRQHQVLDEVGNVAWDSGKVADTKTPGSTITVTVPLGYLRYGRRYRWRWMAWDANGGYSTWSSEGWFICQLTSVSATDIAASDHLYAITPSGQVIAVEEGSDDMGSPVSWYAVYPIPMLEPGTDLLLERVWVVAEVPVGSTFALRYSLSAQGDSDWSAEYSVTPAAGVQVVGVEMPVAAGAEYRSPFARLKLSGTGPFYLYAIKPEWKEAAR